VSVITASNSWSGSGRFANDAAMVDASRAFERDVLAPKTKAGDERRGPRIGTVIAGKYRLDRPLGSGAMASVFAATHVRNASRVALKILHSTLTDDADIRARFLREGYAANLVGHPGTVRALDEGTTEDGVVFFVMDLLEGEPLDAVWERRGYRLPPLEVAQLMCQLLDVLSAAHAKGIVHRDVKPENLFLEPDGTLRVLDFGVARVLDGTLTETRAGSVIGTLPYMAPEQMLGRTHEVDARSDLWSVGATAFTLVSGRFVHDAETPEEMMVFTGSRQVRSLADAASDVAPEFIEVVDRALRFDKRERWASALSMRTAFAAACRSLHPLPPDGTDLPHTAEGQEKLPAQRHGYSPSRPDFTGEEPVCSATLASSGGSAARRVPVWGSRGNRWVAAAGVALALAAALGLRSSHRGTETQTTAPTSVVSTTEPMAPRVEAVAAATNAVVLAPVALAVDVAPSEAVAPAIVERQAESAPERATVVASKPAKAVAPLSSAAHSEAGAVRARPDDCTPPFTIQPVTGKKLWKRECL
jgi:serine/threonine protein kinase